MPPRSRAWPTPARATPEPRARSGTDPPLTTVRQPAYELGATAYELLRSGGTPEQRSFSPHLVERESTAAPPS